MKAALRFGRAPFPFDAGDVFTGTGGPAPSCGTTFRLSLGLGPFVKTLPTAGKAGSVVKILGTDRTGATRLSFNGIAATSASSRLR